MFVNAMFLQNNNSVHGRLNAGLLITSLLITVYILVLYSSIYIANQHLVSGTRW